jgi:hypothetical protein
MRKIEDVRRDNLARLREELGSVNALVERTGKAQSQISQWLNASAKSGSGKPRNISSDSCREIERACDKPDGWMDVEHTGVAAAETTEVVALRRMLAEASAEIRLLSVYRLANDAQREVIDGAVRIVIDQLSVVDILSGRR